MKLKRLISKSLVIGLLFNYTLTSLASILSEDSRYEIFEGNSITIDNILKEDEIDIEIEGNTLVNLLDTSNLPVSTTSYSSVTDRYAFLTDIETKVPLSKDKAYTLSVSYYISKYTPLSDDFNRTAIMPKLCYEDETESFLEIEMINKSGFYSNTVLIEPDKNVTKMYIGLAVRNATVSGYISEVVLVEGNYLDTGNKYFEGIQSIGEKEPLNIISSNKNLINPKECTPIGNYLPAKMLNDKILLESNGIDRISLGFPVYLKKGSSYRFSYHNVEGDENILGKTIQIHSSSVTNNEQIGFSIYKPFVWNMPTGKYFLRVYNMFEVGTVMANIQLEEGESVTPYLKHSSEVLSMNLPEPLRGLPDGTKDRIIKRNGQWVIERNCGKVILDGSEDWFNINGDIGDSVSRFRYKSFSGDLKYTGNVVCDKFKSYGDNDIFNGIEGICDRVNNTGFNIQINNSKLSSIDLNGFKDWLSNNPTTVVYALKNPVYEVLNIDLSIKLFEDITHIYINSVIPASMKITVDRTMNRAVEAIELAKANPTVENLSKARMWSNLLKDSIKKDELQNEINNITNIDDLQMEKKNITANMDLYIKSQNSLSMSLSTNSIVFDDFSGVEDLEKLNAVEITISSSLPYQLNSYLESEIKNSDGSKIIPKELLNIRLNGENDYKAFSDINEKLILKENCLKGNDNQFSIDLILKGSQMHKADVYKTVIKFEAEQK